MSYLFQKLYAFTTTTVCQLQNENFKSHPYAMSHWFHKTVLKRFRQCIINWECLLEIKFDIFSWKLCVICSRGLTQLGGLVQGKVIPGRTYWDFKACKFFMYTKFFIWSSSPFSLIFLMWTILSGSSLFRPSKIYISSFFTTRYILYLYRWHHILEVDWLNPSFRLVKFLKYVSSYYSYLRTRKIVS